MSALGYLTGIAFFVWVIIPLFKKDSTWISLFVEAEELVDRKQRVYGNIADLEFDFAMGRLSERDFKSIRLSFLSEAGKVIEKIEGQKSAEIMNRIQSDLSNLDKKKKNKGKKSGSRSKCSACGTENLSEAKFCMKCGKELS